MSGIMIDKDATVEWLKSWGENTPHMDGARIIEAQDAKIAALEAENAALHKRLVVDDAAVERALDAWPSDERAPGETFSERVRREMRVKLEAALGKGEGE